MAGKSNSKCIRDLYAAFEKKDLAAVESLAGDARWTTVPFEDDTRIVDDMRHNFSAFPDVKFELRNVVEQGDRVVVEGLARGTHRGVLATPQGDIAPTGKRFELPFLEIYEFESGRISRGRMYFDALGFFRQIGIGAPQSEERGVSPH